MYLGTGAKLPYAPAMSKGPANVDPIEVGERGQVEAHEISWALRELTRAAIDVDFHLARRLRLRPLDYAAMNHVMTARDPVGPRELGHRLGISSGSATELVDRLEAAGHLERQRDPRDRRRLSLHPTPQAVHQILAALRPLLADLDALGEQLSEADQDVVRRYLRAASRVLLDYT